MNIIKNIFINLLIITSIVFSQVKLTSSNLPIIVIDTEGKNIVDEPKIDAHMGIIDNGEGKLNYITDPFNGYNGRIGIEIRGQSSQQFDKKQYAIETRDTLGNDIDVSLLGLPKESDWVLNASYIDKSLLRNVLAFKIFNDMGRYASRTKFCELIINGEYRGIYILQEKIKRDKNRVNISKLETADTGGDIITGGYIIKIDKVDFGDKTWTSPYPPFQGSTQKIVYVYYYPDAEEINSVQAEYIKNYVTNFEKVMNASNYNDPFYGYLNYIDLDSFVDMFLIFELSKNVDSYRLSTFFYKDRNKKLCAGPIWDFDLSFGLPDYYDGWLTDGWQYKVPLFNDYWQNPFWVSKLYNDPIFKNKFAKRWNELKNNILSFETISKFIDDCVNKISDAKTRNFEKWNQCFDGKTYIWPNKNKFTSYNTEINYLKNWIKQRLDWLDKNIPAEYSNIDWIEKNDKLYIRYDGNLTENIFYLNDFINSVHNIDSVTFVANNSNIKIKLLDDKIFAYVNSSEEFTVYGLGWKNNQVVSISPKYVFSSLSSYAKDEFQKENEFVLYQNYPNPFNPETIISFQLKFNSWVKLNVYDVLGNKVATLINEEKSAGKHYVKFNGKNLASGIYVYKLISPHVSLSKKMMLMK
ncbi:MAG: CotH kinase family protein [Melioribacter sp.]|uniref:CotH kinase family protein n=1 Tax=Rosettibacter primus TaxID=3111523 RepID=UPI00247EF156|nr:CotH kinase family protein [Melioribacter sp.]